MILKYYLLLEYPALDNVKDYLRDFFTLKNIKYTCEDSTQQLKDSKMFFINHPHLDEIGFFRQYFKEDKVYVSVNFAGPELNSYLFEIEEFSKKMCRHFRCFGFYTKDYGVKTEEGLVM